MSLQLPGHLKLCSLKLEPVTVYRICRTIIHTQKCSGVISSAAPGVSRMLYYVVV